MNNFFWQNFRQDLSKYIDVDNQIKKLNNIKFKRYPYLKQFIQYVSKRFNKSVEQVHIDIVYYLFFKEYTDNNLIKLYNKYIKLLENHNQNEVEKILENFDFNYDKETNYIPGRTITW